MTVDARALLADLERHQRSDAYPDREVCAGCGSPWPCDAAKCLNGGGWLPALIDRDAEIQRLREHNRKLTAEHQRHSLAVEAHKARADASESRAVHAEKQLRRWAVSIEQYERLTTAADEGVRASLLAKELRRQLTGLEGAYERAQKKIKALEARP